MVIAFGNSIKLHINYKTKQVIYQVVYYLLIVLLRVTNLEPTFLCCYESHNVYWYNLLVC